MLHPKTTVFERFIERSFSSLAWPFSWPFSSPSAALSSSPAATLHAAVAGIARAFRFSVCSWRFHVRTFLVKNPAERHPQNSGQGHCIYNQWCRVGMGFFRVCQNMEKVGRRIFENCRLVWEPEIIRRIGIKYHFRRWKNTLKIFWFYKKSGFSIRRQNKVKHEIGWHRIERGIKITISSEKNPSTPLVVTVRFFSRRTYSPIACFTV